MNYPLLFSYMLTILLFLGTPGPVTLLVINASLKEGFWAGVKTIAGTNAASLLLIGLSFVVIQGVFAVSETALLWLTLFGCFYLMYFAVGMLKERADGQTPLQATQAKVSRRHFRDGFIVGVSNPKDILFFIGFFPLFLGISPAIHWSMLMLVLVWVALDYTILSVYALAFSRLGKKKISNVISRLSGVVLLLLAVYALGHTSVALWRVYGG